MKKFALLVLLFCLAACDGDFKMSDFAGTWKLASMNGQPVPDTMREGGITLKVQEDGKFGGQAPVNRYFGQIKIEGDTVKTGPVGATMMAGSPEFMAAERAFFKTLNDVKSVDVKDDSLTISGADGKQLVFERVK